MPKVAGPCSGYYPKWFYDKDRKHCAQFIYGGCLGNVNQFDTREECVSLCSKETNEGTGTISQQTFTFSEKSKISLQFKKLIEWDLNYLRQVHVTSPKMKVHAKAAIDVGSSIRTPQRVSSSFTVDVKQTKTILPRKKRANNNARNQEKEKVFVSKMF